MGLQEKAEIRRQRNERDKERGEGGVREIRVDAKGKEREKGVREGEVGMFKEEGEGKKGD